MSRVLVLTADEELKKVMKEGLTLPRGDLFTSPEEGLAALDCSYYPLMICDSFLKDEDLTAFLEQAGQRNNHDAVLLLLSGPPGSREEKLLKEGVIQGVLEKPFSPWQIRSAVQEILDGLARNREYLNLSRDDREGQGGGRGRLVGVRGDLSGPFQKVKHAAAAGRGLFIQGEPGSGKETMARVYRKYSQNGQDGLAILSCASLVPGETPPGGVLYIKDLDRCPEGLEEILIPRLKESSGKKKQPKKKVPPLNLIASSRRPLDQLEAEGVISRRFLEVWAPETITIPPLRDRKHDFGRLLAHFVEKTSRELGRFAPRLHRSSIRKLHQYRWPGNVAELEGVIRRAVVVTGPEADQIPEESFDILFLGHPLPGGPEYRQAIQILARRLMEGEGSLREIESHVLETVVVLSGGSISRAVERSGIPKDRFYRYYKKKGFSQP